MQKLNVTIERFGKRVPVGVIEGTDPLATWFSYSPEYLHSPDAAAISLSLPLQEEAFSPAATKNFFEGLLPEGFTRRSVAQWMRVDENDYLSILLGLGKECLGALQILEEGEEAKPNHYEKLSYQQVSALAREGAGKSAELVARSHLSLTGASGKVGLYYEPKSGVWYLPKGSAPSTHIVKQSHVRLDQIVTNEQLALRTARYAGIRVPDSFIIETGGTEDDKVLLATERYDRYFVRDPEMADGLPVPYRLHQEDFAQALGISGADKYERPGGEYLKQVFELLRRYSVNPVLDQMMLWDIIIFDFLIGNTDNHIKNLSLLYGKDLKTVRLAPAYDILSTSIYYESSREFAFSIGGTYSIDEMDRSSFQQAAAEVGLGPRMAMQRYDLISSRFLRALSKAAKELTEKGFTGAEELRERILLTGGCRVLK